MEEEDQNRIKKVWILENWSEIRLYDTESKNGSREKLQLCKKKQGDEWI